MTRFRGFPVAARLVVPTRKRKQQKQEYQDAVTANDTREYIVTTDEAVPTPPANQVSHYRTADGWREKDETGTASDVGGGGGGDSGILTATGQLDNAAMLGLELAPVTLVGAPGANRAILPLRLLLISTIETEYEDVQSENAYLKIGHAGAGFAGGMLVEYDDGQGVSTSGVSEFLSGSSVAVLPGIRLVDELIPLQALAVSPTARSSIVNRALELQLYNGSVPLAGGDAANSISWKLWYLDESLDPADYA